MPNQNNPNERAVAAKILIEVTENGAYASLALKAALDKNKNFEPRQRSFVTELVNGTLRNLIYIDYLIDAFAQIPVKKMKPMVRTALRTGIYQIRWMDKVPAHSAVDEAVKLVRNAGLHQLTGFVNGVLRNFIRRADSLPAPPPDVRYSFPPWLADALGNWIGLERCEDFFKQSHITPSVTVCANLLKTTREDLRTALTQEGVDCTASGLHEETLFLRHTGMMEDLSAFRKGWFHVLDDGALLAVKALSLQPGQTVIDLCAAPGGKSFACAYEMQNNGQIFSFDLHEHKNRLMAQAAKRLGITCMTIKTQDATIPDESLLNSADAVLLDAPCSGFGILRKKPEIKYTKTYEDVRALAALQKTLLKTAAAYVKPGGVLVYCTCTITSEENDENLAWFLQEQSFTLASRLQLLPDAHNDGFFIASLLKLS